MSENLKNISPWTAIVVVAGIAGMCVLAHYNVPVEAVVGYGGFFVGFAGAMERLVGGSK